MLIHTTKKALSQFKNPTHEVDLTETDDHTEILNWSILPYEIDDHQGMLTLNDYTNFAVIIPQTRPFKSFDDFFEAFSLTLMSVCESMDISFIKIEAYLNDIKIDHKTIMQMSNHSKAAGLLEVYKEKLIQNANLLDLPNDPQNVMAAVRIGRDFPSKLNDYRNPLAAFKFEITAKYLFPADVADNLDDVKIKPTWDPYSQWKEMDGKISSDPDEMNNFRLAVEKNNSIMLARFKRYLQGASYSQRKIALMMSYARDYLDQFLLTILHQTFIHDLSILPAYFAEFMPAQRQNPLDEPVAFETLSELADFWEASGQISADDHEIIDHELNETKKIVQTTFYPM